MSTFTTPCRVELVGNYKFKIIEPFEYHIGEYPAKDPEKIVRVKVGFITDFASVPRPFWSILSPCDEYAKAAVIHDWLYRKGYFDKAESDLIFKEAMEVLNVPTWKIGALYNGVKNFGGFTWRNYRNLYGSSNIGDE